MNIILFDDHTRKDLLPLTFTRPVAGIRVGILTIAEKWQRVAKAKVSFETVDYLREKFPAVVSSKEDNFFINGKISPDKKLVAAIKKLKPGQALKHQNFLLAYNSDQQNTDRDKMLGNANEYSAPIFAIHKVWEIFAKNGEAIKADFEILTKGKRSKPLSKSNTVVGPKNMIFIESGASVEASIFNTKNGPIYIGKDAEVMEGSVVRGPFALCEHSTLKLSAKVYGPSTIGPHCKVGGEINNSVIFGFSNKAHDGFLGNSVLGEWCNLGADTNNSNLKNNYGNVKLHSYASNKPEDTGLQFCGLIMGDHSKSGINTMFNTGTVVGVAANVFGGGFPPTHIPSFSWGGAEKMEVYRLDKMFETTEKVFQRRSLKLEQADRKILEEIFRNR